MQSDQSNFIATAFISCSLRPEDKPFVDFIEEILVAHGIKPYGTVGRYSVAPMNTAELMKLNILSSDFVMVVATPRYIQKDFNTEYSKYAISEMLHVELGMAHMADKPLVVFVKEGTEVGNFIPTVTQYITLNGKKTDLLEKWKLIGALLKSTYSKVSIKRQQEQNRVNWNAIKIGFAIVGAVNLVEAFSEEEKPKRRTLRSKPR